jgi:hypothetical protein
MTPFSLARTTAAGVLLVASVAPALAATTINMRFDDPADNVGAQGDGLISRAGTSLTADGAVTTSTAAVDHGLIRLKIVADAASGPGGSTAAGSVDGSFSDSFRIFDPAIANGTFGIATFAIAVSGALTGGPDSSAVWRLDASINATPLLKLQGNDDASDPFRDDAFGIYTASFPFRFGRLERVNVVASCAVVSGHDNALNGARGACDLGHTITWEGFTSIVADGGLALAGPTLSSDSGTNYLVPYAAAAAVPEPHSWMLVLAGLTALGLSSRRRRPRR